MKKFIFLSVFALLFAATMFAQSGISRPTIFNTTMNGWTNFKGVPYFNAPYVYGSETISNHNDTLKGKYPLVVVTATRKDTVKLYGSNYQTGQIFNILATGTSNDSTCLLPTSGKIQGLTQYWFTTDTSTYKSKSITLYYNGTNYYILN